MGLSQANSLAELADKGKKLLGELEKAQIVPMLRGPQSLVEFLQLRIIARIGQQFETLARTSFDERRDHQPIHQFLGALPFANQLVQRAGVRIRVRFG